MHTSDNKLRSALFGAAALLGLGLTLSACATHTATGPDARSAAPVATAQASPAQPTTKAPTGLTKNDVKLTLDVISQDCFGSAGCNVTVKPKLAVDYTKLGDDSYDITYSIKGSDEGPSVGTFTVNPDHSYDSDEKYLSTASSKTKLTVSVVKVEKDGL